MLTTEDFTHFPVQMWAKVLSKVKKAVVFMDDKCAEALHWCGGAAVALEAGARNLKEFSSFEACAVNEPKAVFVVSTLLKGRTVDVIKDIITLSHFQYCVVFTTVAHSVHLLANNVPTEMEGSPVFEQFEEKLCEWMGSMNYTAEVLHAPVVFAPVSQQLLLTPPFAHLFPLLSPDLESLNEKRPEKKRFGSLVDVDMHSLPVGLQLEIKSLASALNSLFEATGAVGHHGDNLVEKILTVLQRLPGHVTDVQVDMLELTGVQRTPHSQSTLAPGCLAQTQVLVVQLTSEPCTAGSLAAFDLDPVVGVCMPVGSAEHGSPAAQSLWEAMLTNKHKEGVMEVRRQLVETASKEKLPIKMSMGKKR
ncbi:hypothetical protein FQN60_013163, partial [Etheostoma spectabile]